MDYLKDGCVVLSLQYNRKGRITALLPGVGLTRTLLDEVEKEVRSKLLSPARKMVYKFPIFATVPTEGYWRHGNKVVLRRAPDEAPRPFFLLAPHPLIIEVRFDGSDDSLVRHLRAQREPREFALFLSLPVPWLTVPSNHGHKSWVTPMTSADLAASPTVLAQAYCQIPDFQAYADDFSDQGNLPDIEIVESLPTAIGSNEVLTLPRNLPALVDAFMLLDERLRRKVLRAAYWLHYAREVWHLSKSASYQALIQAVEVLIEVPPGRDMCPGCQRAIGLGPTKLFIQFIDRYAPPGDSEGLARRILYEVRSQLVHGDMLLHMDEAGLTQLAPRMNFEYELMNQARSICRRAIVRRIVDLAKNDAHASACGL